MRVTLLVSSDPAVALGLATSWAAAGETVTAVLLDAATGLLRRAHPDHDALEVALHEGVSVLAQVDGSHRRGSGDEAAVKGVDLDEIAELVTHGADKVVWW